MFNPKNQREFDRNAARLADLRLQLRQVRAEADSLRADGIDPVTLKNLPRKGKTWEDRRYV